LTTDDALFCHRCAAELQPGAGDFYVVKIEAFADPTPPSISAEDLHRDFRAEIDRLIEQMSDLSDTEAMNQIYQKLTIYLCGPCYRKWIEDPAGEDRT